jgi:hypothetical protein
MHPTYNKITSRFLHHLTTTTFAKSNHRRATITAPIWRMHGGMVRWQSIILRARASQDRIDFSCPLAATSTNFPSLTNGIEPTERKVSMLRPVTEVPKGMLE